MNERRRLLQGGAGLLLALTCGSCRRSESPPNDAALAPPRRIVSLSPNTTEALFALGAGDRVVGRSRFCDYPPEVAQIPSVGGYVDASLEVILALSPDLVVGARGPAGPMLVQKLVAFGIPTFFPSTESMAEIDDMLQALGARLGIADAGQRLVEKVRARRGAVSRALESEPVVRVLFLFGLSPIVAAGPASFANEMVELARGRNVVTGGGAYPTLSAERLIVLAPDLVINGAAMTGASHGGGLVRGDPSLAEHPALRELGAVRAGRTVAIYDETVIRPGPRVGEGLATLARAIHPAAAVP